MEELSKRRFEVGQIVYVLDIRETSIGARIFSTYAEILEVYEEAQTFSVMLYGNKYNTYSFEDYGRLFFHTAEAAAKVANKLPHFQSIVYLIIGTKVCKRTIINMCFEHIDGVVDLIICLNNGRRFSTKRLNQSIFTNESDARKRKKRKK